MATLFDYMTTTQKFLHDQRQEMINPQDIIDYVNRARREVAMRAQCLRILTPVTGAIISASVTNPGAHYSSSASISFSAPDFPSGTLPYPNGAQATGTLGISGGTISSVVIAFGGSGYFEPIATVTDTAGSGATITPVLSWFNQTSLGQELYPFSSVSLSTFPGILAILAVKSVSIIYSNYRYSLPCYSFSTYQSMMRQYPFQYQWAPTVCAQFGQGVNGSFYMYPIPSQPYQMEWDCICLPQDLTTNQSVEALQLPWTDAVPYFAAHLAFLELQNFNSAKGFLDLFDRQLSIYSAAARPGRVENPYGRR